MSSNREQTSKPVPGKHGNCVIQLLPQKKLLGTNEILNHCNILQNVPI